MKHLNIFYFSFISVILSLSSCRKEPNLDSGLFGTWTNSYDSSEKLSFSRNGKCSEWDIAYPNYSDTYDWYVEGSYIHFYQEGNGGVSSCVYQLSDLNSALTFTCDNPFDGNWEKD